MIPSPTSVANGRLSSRSSLPPSSAEDAGARPVSAGPSTNGGSAEAGLQRAGWSGAGAGGGAGLSGLGGGGCFLQAKAARDSVRKRNAPRIGGHFVAADARRCKEKPQNCASANTHALGSPTVGSRPALSV